MAATTQVIDTKDLVRNFVDDIYNRQTRPLIFIDQEGQDLCRHGTIAIMQILAPPSPTVFLLDTHVLGRQAFDTPGTCNLTWANILESEQYVKVFFDVRNDSDALFNIFQIDLRGVVDVQLFELASRPGQGRFLKGLAKCTSENPSIPFPQRVEWRKIKNNGALLFTPERGGSCQVFEQRPLPPAIQQYCAEDVLKLPALLKAYAPQVSRLASQIGEKTLKRVAVARDPDFDGRGKHMAIAPTFNRRAAGSEYELTFSISLICSPELDGLCVLGEAKPEVARLLGSSEDNDPVADCPAQSVHPSQGSPVFQRESDEIIEASGQSKEKEPRDEASFRTDVTKVPLDASAEHSDHSFNPVLDYTRELDPSYSDEDQVGDDFAACSLDDCGYCGRCMY